MRAIGLCFALLFSAHGALGCANFTGSATSFSGAETNAPRGSVEMMLRRIIRKSLHDDGVKIEASLRGATNFNDRSDYSIALMYLGRSNEAVDILRQLEREKPGEYYIAANLGTAYELSGNNEEALRWINEGIRRNAASHQGTEWLHSKIIESKIAQQKDPDYFKSHSVLELEPEQLGSEVVLGEITLMPKALKEAIQYQLQERLQFVKPPDASVASLLFDYAAVEAATRTLESAKGLLQMAMEYGYPPDKVRPLMKTYEERIWWRKFKQYTRNGLIGIGLMSIVVLLLRFLYRRGVFVLSSRDLEHA